ncbi:hypothetical protein ACIRPX_32255 [Streptomyces sp. NPDC101225]|uniref:hypothetical protein n=1 Tax=Streptomyces sp. NPDC101225 TaxID=3366135 RepID=UPI0038288441
MVPSLSSRGFDIRQDGLSEVAAWLPAVQDQLTDSLLVSAYDLHYGLLPDVHDFLTGNHWQTLYATPEVLIVDSGGYELGTSWDGSEVRRGERQPNAFSRTAYVAVVERLPTDQNIVLVTWDHVATASDRLSYKEQIEAASVLKRDNPRVLIDCLVKPQEGELYVNVDALAPEMNGLRSVDFIGLTEKELGDTLFDRALTLARLRAALDSRDISAPIHVFGALDPLFMRLYFDCGAEIFDGLTWLRYGLAGGRSVYREVSSLLDGDVHYSEPIRRARQQAEYLRGLRALQNELRSSLESKPAQGGVPVSAETVSTVIQNVLSKFA